MTVVCLDAYRQSQERFSVQVTSNPDAKPTVSKMLAIFDELHAHASRENLHAVVEGVHRDKDGCVFLEILTWRRGA